MDAQKRQFKDKDLPEVRQELAAELKQLCRAPGSVPAEVDQAIMEQAREHFRGRRQLPQVNRRRYTTVVWRWGSRAAAVAAVLAIVWLIFPSRMSESPPPGLAERTVKLEATMGKDIDRNGRVDILDAFEMARRLEGRGTPEAHWDFNGDGVVDRHDVDMVAYAAVQIHGRG